MALVTTKTEKSSVEWETPQELFDLLNREFHFTLDAAATAANAKCPRYYTKAEDGLSIHNQLFLPKDIKPGERRPAIVFVHGGPIRQMLLGYHYMYYY